MSIFTNLDYTIIENSFDFGRDFTIKTVPEKAVGKNVYSHTMYKEITETELNKLFEQRFKKIFTIYRIDQNETSIVLLLRVDGMVNDLNAPALIVYDSLKIKKASRFIEGTVNYCIDEVESNEYHTIADLKLNIGPFQKYKPIAHGEWKYFNNNNSILYYGHHIKKQIFELMEIDQKPFQMMHQLTFKKNYWSREDFSKFTRNKFIDNNF